MSTTRTIHCWETQYDAQLIKKNKWLWHVAKAVSTGSGSASSNVIWQSQGLAPTTSVAWDVIYALNWTADVPASGVTVGIGGKWQECAKGEVYDLDDLGFWQASSEPAKEGWMKVGKVNYKYPGVPGIHVIVGVKNAVTGKFDDIFVDPAALPPGSTAVYQPQENIIWWYEAGNMTGQVYSNTRGSVGKQDMSDPAPKTNKFEWWTTYTFDDGHWTNSQTAPNSDFTNPPASEVALNDAPVEADWYPIIRYALFGMAIGAGASQTSVRNYVYNALASKFTSVEVNFTTDNGNVLSIRYGPPKSAVKGTREYVGVPVGDGGDPDAPIDAALKTALSHHVLPDGETWRLCQNPE